MIRAVLDTNVFLRGLLNPHSRCGLLLNELSSTFTLLLSPAIIEEILEVLQRPKLRKKYPRLDEINVSEIRRFLEQAELVEPLEVELVCRDPDDDIFLACALHGHASFVVSEDRDLLEMKAHRGIVICRPGEFVLSLIGV